MWVHIGVNWWIRCRSTRGALVSCTKPIKMQLGADSWGPKRNNALNRGCTLAPPGEYDGFTFATAAMRPVSNARTGRPTAINVARSQVCLYRSLCISLTFYDVMKKNLSSFVLLLRFVDVLIHGSRPILANAMYYGSQECAGDRTARR